jgi:hypothetical protein
LKWLKWRVYTFYHNLKIGRQEIADLPENVEVGCRGRSCPKFGAKNKKSSTEVRRLGTKRRNTKAVTLSVSSAV